MNGLPLPPGPKGYPLIGNLFDMSVNRPWIVYDEWRKTYGKTFIINGLSPQITGHFRWYDIPQCSWPTHSNFKFLGSHHWPVRKKVFKTLRQKANDYDEWTVCIKFLSSRRTCRKCHSMQNKYAYSHMACGGESTRDYFTSISTVTWWLNTNLSKDKRFMPFYVDYLLHPTTFFTTFDSKHRT